MFETIRPKTSDEMAEWIAKRRLARRRDVDGWIGSVVDSEGEYA